ncbi:conjugal transfer protein TraD, partial [Salmonella enterica]|nr:conjugal transfer protein TraD [Salmonella enterica]ECJ4781254.1 conjugal transfer protein TraD [Salmonella enterica subsp. diarizonae]EHC7479152.1 conjugal transfer protein TraD [Salmonella enterica subsp. enterica serovar Chomedey]EEG7825274.1 conjugal transfer protein TraD [Salmonella enterica]EFP1214884.1 conjugal transfer protein TraD [Salmonella enterica]
QQPQSTVAGDKKSATAGTAVNTPAGGVGQELKMKPEDDEQPLPPGINESGEVVDMAAYEAWQAEQELNTQQQMQRREEVNINVHRDRGEDVEPGDDF